MEFGNCENSLVFLKFYQPATCHHSHIITNNWILLITRIPKGQLNNTNCVYQGADKSLARPTSQCILFDGENISFQASLVIYIYIYIYIHTHT